MLILPCNRLLILESKVQTQRSHEHNSNEYIIYSKQVPPAHHHYYHVQACNKEWTALLEIVLCPICGRLPYVLTKGKERNCKQGQVAGRQGENLQVV